MDPVGQAALGQTDPVGQQGAPTGLAVQAAPVPAPGYGNGQAAPAPADGSGVPAGQPMRSVDRALSHTTTTSPSPATGTSARRKRKRKPDPTSATILPPPPLTTSQVPWRFPREPASAAPVRSDLHASLTPTSPFKAAPTMIYKPSKIRKSLHQRPSAVAALSRAASSEDIILPAIRVQMTEQLRESNLQYMFPDGHMFRVQHNCAYFEFPTLEEAQAAADRANTGEISFDIKVDVDRSCDTPDRLHQAMMREDASTGSQIREDALARGSQCREVILDGHNSKRRFEDGDLGQLIKRQKKEERRIGMDFSVFKWQRVAKFAAVKGHEFVELFKFELASSFGSVCSSASMCSINPIGSLVFTGLLGYMGKGFTAGLSWGGKINLDSLVIAHHMCAIIPYPTEAATFENISKDVHAVMHSLIELYRIDNKLPAYFDDLLSYAEHIPNDIATNPAVLKQFLLELINHGSFQSDPNIVAALQEFHSTFKNLGVDEQEDFNEEAEAATITLPTDWQNTVKTDRLLSLIFDRSHGALLRTFASEAAFHRHFTVHTIDIIGKASWYARTSVRLFQAISDYPITFRSTAVDLPLVFKMKERNLMMAYYFRTFLPAFFRIMFRLMRDTHWIEQLIKPFIKSECEVAAAPLGAYEIQEDCACDSLVQVLTGTGTAELTSCLNMSILAMGNVKKFRDDLPIGLQQHQTLHINERQDDITCVRCVLTAINDDLSDPSKKQIDSVSLTLLMNALAKCWSGHKDFLMGGRNYAAKVFELILKLLHDSCIGYGVNAVKSCSCLPHILYSIEVKSLECRKCGLGSRVERHNQFTHQLTAASTRCIKSKYPEDTFDVLLKREMEISKLCLGCGETTCLKESLGRCPHAFVVALEWCHEESAGEIDSTLAAISTTIDLSVIYGALEEKTNHTLVSMLCHSEDMGSHFTCFTLEKGSWMLYDGAKKEVAGLWENVKDICFKRVLKPQILLFAAQE